MLRHSDTDFAEVKLEYAKVFPVDEVQKRPGFALVTSTNVTSQFYARTVLDRDEWVKYLAKVIRNLSEETQVFCCLIVLIQWFNWWW